MPDCYCIHLKLAKRGSGVSKSDALGFFFLKITTQISLLQPLRRRPVTLKHVKAIILMKSCCEATYHLLGDEKKSFINMPSMYIRYTRQAMYRGNLSIGWQWSVNRRVAVERKQKGGSGA